MSERVGGEFRRLRIASGRSPNRIAAELAIPVRLLDELEQGAIGRLPPWPETERIIRGYCRLAQVESRPLLKQVKLQLDALAGKSGAAPRGQGRSTPIARRRQRSSAARLAISVAAGAALPLAAIAVMWAIARNPDAAYKAAGALPAPVDRYARAGVEWVVLGTDKP